MRDAVELSLKVLALATPIIFIGGIAFALLLARVSFPGLSILETLIMLPLVLPPSVVGYVLLRLIGRDGPIDRLFGVNMLFTWEAAALASALVGLPLMLQASKIGILGVDRHVEDAARVDGATTLRVILTITLPLARRGLIVGLSLGTVRALGEFGATLTVAGNIPGRTQTMPLAIYDAMQRGDFNLANKIGAVMIVLGFVAVWGTNKLIEKDRTST